MNRLRHIALVVSDLDRSAAFYTRALGMTRSAQSESTTARRVFLSDGHTNLALLQYKSGTGSGLDNPEGFVGPHHFGFQVPDLREARQRIEDAGGTFFFDLGKENEPGFERKFRDPDGIIFDINTTGWPLRFDGG
jgi:catechol 2,3-dioxygenase-like lactoylglutathione lyase family enzyme